MLLSRVGRRTLGEAKRSGEAMHAHYLGAHRLLCKGWKETCSLSDNHLVHDLNSLLANLKSKSLQLGLDAIETTGTTWMDATGSAFLVE